MKQLRFFLLLFTLVIGLYCKEIDLFFSGLFFQNSIFIYKEHPVLLFIYHFGIYPAYLVLFLCLVMYFFSFLSPSLIKIKKPVYYLLFVFILGPGLLVNGLLKEGWGRPRPVQITEFKGSHTYSPFYLPQFENARKLKSFPSGHASNGFYFMSLIFLGRRVGNRQLTRWGYYLTGFFAPLLSFTRVAQGGHFFSDVWMSGIVLFILCSLLDELWLKNHYPSSNSSKA